MTDKLLSRFPLLLKEIFQNGLRDRLPPGFMQIGKLLIICRNGRSHDGQVITSDWSKIVPETHVCKKWVDMDAKMTLVVFGIHFQSYPGLVDLFFMIFHEF